MKKINDFLILSAFVAGLASSTPIFAQTKMNTETQDLVITKMERVLSTLDKKDAAWLPSQQRLADLLSERARARFMSEIEANCNGCKGSTADRQKAISIYEQVLKSTSIQGHGPILLQLAHLYEMAGQTSKAISLHEDILKANKKRPISKDIERSSRVGLADLYFQKGDFKQSKKHYDIALKDKELKNRYISVYNLAWSEYNLGNLNTAIKHLEGLVAKPELIARETEDNIVYDAPFHTDVLRDLAGFYTRRTVSKRDINFFNRNTPEDKKKDLLLFFAKETDRVGQKQAAGNILDIYLSDKTLSREERIEATILLAQISYDKGQIDHAVSEFAKAAQDLQKEGCKKNKCEEIRSQMRRFVTELHRTKKLKPDNSLLNAYVTYNNTFGGDKDMLHRGSVVALELKNYPTAIALFRGISGNKKFSDKEREEAILNEINAAELSNVSALKQAAYENYLSNFSKTAKAFEIRYQLAYLSYQDKDYAKAVSAFTRLAKDDSGKMELRKKSADLALDSLAIAKRDEDLEELAWDFSRVFPKSAKEFDTIARKSLNNRVAVVATNKNSSKRDAEKALSQLDNRKLHSATNAEKILFFNNKAVLAKKADNEAEYISAMNSLITNPDTKDGQKQAYLKELIGYYEQKMKFADAYKTALRLNEAKKPSAEFEAQLGTLADLAGMSPQKHYRNALKKGLKGDRAFSLRMRLIETANNPASELKTQAGALAKKPAFLNEAVLLTYARTKNQKQIQAVINRKELRNQSAPKFFKKQSLYDRIIKTQPEIAKHDLNTKNDRVLARSIEARMALLGKASKLLSESVAAKDVTAEMMSLYIVASENERMVRDLAALPLPASLKTEKEKAQYLNLLKQQSRPFWTLSKEAYSKIDAVWAKSNGISQLIREYKSARPEIKSLLARELNLLVQVPGKGAMKSALESALSERQISANDLESARASVAAEPTDVTKIETLKELETKIGNPVMVSYLEVRLNSLKRGKSL